MIAATINLPEWDGTPRDVADVWTLRKGSRVASCHLWTHPKRGEIRLTVDGEWHRGEALGDGLALVDLALEWRKQFETKGWTAVSAAALSSITVDEWSLAAQREEILDWPELGGKVPSLDQQVDKRLADSKTLEEAARVLYHLLDGGYAVWTDGTLYFAKALVDTIGQLRIEIRLNEHAPPHFHVTTTQGISASFAIDDYTLLAGRISGRDRALVERWHSRSRARLVSEWNRTRPSDCTVGPIEE